MGEGTYRPSAALLHAVSFLLLAPYKPIRSQACTALDETGALKIEACPCACAAASDEDSWASILAGNWALQQVRPFALGS